MPFFHWLRRLSSPGAPADQSLRVSLGDSVLAAPIYRVIPVGRGRKVAPEGQDEIDFDQRIAHWDRLIDPPGNDPLD